MTIIELENKYLESSEKRTLERFYDSVLKLSFAIVKESFPGKDIKVAFDLATDLSIRLMITKEPIFKTSPSGYINQALKLIFCKKNKGAILLEDKDICGDPVDCLCDIEIKDLIDSIKAKEDIKRAIYDCYKDKENYLRIFSEFPESRKKEIQFAIKEIKRKCH